MEALHEFLDLKRAERISKGSGVSTKDIRELVKQYNQGKKLVKMMKGKDMDKMMRNLGSMGNMPKFKFK